ncbi:MAG: cysteine synthase family protein [Pirellulales bacterium]|nr:cysteine synthase family protein [Pirellulales bacterium]
MKPSLFPEIENRIQGLKHIIGNTPMLAIECAWRGKRRIIYAKAEHQNFTGSTKDRMAYHILKRAYQEGRIEPGDQIVEATSGNTGIAFAAIGRALGHPITVFMPDWMSQERTLLIQSYGAQMVPVARERGGVLGSIRLTEELAAREPHIFLPHQYSNEANVEAHEQTTGPEIWAQLASQGLKPAAFVAGVGTGGTVMGVGRYFRKMDPAIRVYPLEASESPTLSRGHKAGKHRIQGISDEFIPEILKLDQLDRIVQVHDGDAIRMAQQLAAQLGLGVGISSGANFLGALMIQNELGPDAVVATVFPDDNKKYLSTDLLRKEPAQDDYLSPHVELLGYRAFNRAFSLYED